MDFVQSCLAGIEGGNSKREAYSMLAILGINYYYNITGELNIDFGTLQEIQG